MLLGSGKQPMPISNLHFPCNCREKTNVLPLFSEARFIAWIFHQTNGPPNVSSFVKNAEVAWKILLFHIMEKKHIASSYNQGIFSISITHPQAIGSFLVQQVTQPCECKSAPMPLCSGKQHLLISYLDFSRKYG